MYANLLNEWKKSELLWEWSEILSFEFVVIAPSVWKWCFQRTIPILSVLRKDNPSVNCELNGKGNETHWQRHNLFSGNCVPPGTVWYRKNDQDDKERKIWFIGRFKIVKSRILFTLVYKNEKKINVRHIWYCLFSWFCSWTSLIWLHRLLVLLKYIKQSKQK